MTSNRKVRLVAVNIASMMREWPDMTYEDAQGINRHMTFSYRTYEYSTDDPDGAYVGDRKLSRNDLRSAWELAQSMAMN